MNNKEKPIHFLLYICPSGHEIKTTNKLVKEAKNRELWCFNCKAYWSVARLKVAGGIG